MQWNNSKHLKPWIGGNFARKKNGSFIAHLVPLLINKRQHHVRFSSSSLSPYSRHTVHSHFVFSWVCTRLKNEELKLAKLNGDDLHFGVSMWPRCCSRSLFASRFVSQQKKWTIFYSNDDHAAKTVLQLCRIVIPWFQAFLHFSRISAEWSISLKLSVCIYHLYLEKWYFNIPEQQKIVWCAA